MSDTIPAAKPAPKGAPDTISPERAPHLFVPLRWFLLGLFYLLTLLLVSIWKAPMLAADYLHNPATLAVTHLFTLGFGGSVVTGAIYQLVPVMLYSRLRSERLANWHLVLHGAGVAAMVTGFLLFQPLWVASGGTAVLTGALLFVGNLIATFRAVERPNWHGNFVAGAIVFYLSTLIWGLIMAFNQRYGFWGEVEGAKLSFHLTLGLLGWFGLMVVGVGMKLIPMFAPGKSLPVWLVTAVGGGYTGGVLLMLAGLFWRAPVLWTGIGFVGLALLGYSGAVVYSLIRRRPGPLDLSVRYGVTAAVLLLLPLLLFFPAGRQLRAGLVFLFALGWIGSTMLGMLLRIIPFMVWLHRFRNRLTKTEKIPFLHETFQRHWGVIAYYTWFPGITLMAAGIGFGVEWLITGGAVVTLLGMGAFGWAMRQVLHHIKPGTPALFPGKK
ncbi:MAG: hypothetical protein ACM3XM_12985 [Mycobacterium leprae]